MAGLHLLWGDHSAPLMHEYASPYTNITYLT